jgi:transcriptional regulator with XRE-family HTH domain
VRPIKLFKAERKARRISQQNVEAVTGVPQPLISLIENGRLVPTPDQLERLAAVFNIKPEDLLRDVVVLESSR